MTFVFWHSMYNMVPIIGIRYFTITTENTNAENISKYVSTGYLIKQVSHPFDISCSTVKFYVK